MNARARRLFVAFLIAAICQPAVAADFSAYVVLTTDYVWRGVSQSDSDPAAQLGADISFDSGVYLGAWGSTIDIESGPDHQRDTELTWYSGYSHDADDQWTLGVTLVAYTYPGQSGPIDYNYEELMVSANFEDRLWLDYAYTHDLYHSGKEAHNFEAYFESPLGKHLVVGAGAGYYDVSSVVGDGYAYWELGVTWPVDRFDLDLRYHDTNRWVPFVSSPDRAEARVVFSLRITF